MPDTPRLPWYRPTWKKFAVVVLLYLLLLVADSRLLQEDSMDTSTASTWLVKIETIQTILFLGMVAAVLWYAWEARRMRQSMEEQIALSHQQFQAYITELKERRRTE